MQDRAVLGDVDPLAGDHAVAPAEDVRLLGERMQQRHGLRGHVRLGIVEQQAFARQREALEALRVLGEALVQGDNHRLIVVGL